MMKQQKMLIREQQISVPNSNQDSYTFIKSKILRRD